MRKREILGICAAVLLGTVAGAALILRDAVARLLAGDDGHHLYPIDVTLYVDGREIARQTQPGR